MRTASLVPNGELSDHVRNRNGGSIAVEFELAAGLRDVVQSTGIPHLEVERAEVNRQPAEWDTLVDHEDRIELWPRYPLRASERDPRFILDVHLGKLGRHLRLLGFDAQDPPDIDDAAIAAAAASDGRILLTRDRRLLMRSVITRGRWIRAVEPIEQAAEVLNAFRLADSANPFTRCLECNGELHPIDAAAVDVPDQVRRRHTEFTQCTTCHRPYWRGTHVEQLEATVTEILGALDPPPS